MLFFTIICYTCAQYCAAVSISNVSNVKSTSKCLAQCIESFKAVQNIDWISEMPLFGLSQMERKTISIIGIKHCFSCINVCQVPREVLKTEAEGQGFNTFRGTWQTLMYWKTMFDRSLLLHNFNEMFGNICEKCGTLFC